MCLCNPKWYLWIFSFCTIEAFQKTVNIVKPCNTEQQYTLGRRDSLYIEASGWPEKACTASVMAAEGCSRICVTILSYRFDWCTMSINIYDSNVWDFDSDLPAVRRGCSSDDRIGSRVWCSSGKSVTVRLESETRHVDRGYKFEARLHARADCASPAELSPAELSPAEDLSHTMMLTRMVFIGIVIGAVFGGILVASVCFIIIYCLCLKKRNRQDSSSTGQSYISVPMQPTAPPSDTLRLQAQVHSGQQSPISNPTYQQPKGSIIEIKSIPPQAKH